MECKPLIVLTCLANAIDNKKHIARVTDNANVYSEKTIYQAIELINRITNWISNASFIINLVLFFDCITHFSFSRPF